MPDLHPLEEFDYERPDWTNDALEVRCPLCEYNLRGLIDPRCPECGYQFEWRDLLNPASKSHPYLFELYRGNHYAAFWKTAFHGWCPTKFWKTIRADQPIVRPRLVLYALVVGAFCLAAVTAVYLTMNLAVFLELQATNKYLATGSLPVIITPNSYYWLAYDSSVFDASIVFGRPVLTFVSLMIFQVSMRRAEVKAIHVLRCVIYSSDVVLWIALAALVVHAYYAVEIFYNTQSSLVPILSFRVPAWDIAAMSWAWSACTLIFGYRLAIAYRHYLRFRHCAVTILASQFIVFLIMCIWIVRSNLR